MKMRNLFYLLSVIGCAAAGNAAAQTSPDPVLLTVAGQNVTKSDFERVYHKNNFKEQGAEKKNLTEYLDLFINYKLKVREAEEMGLDSGEAFKNELAGYRKQLAQPYLIDKEVISKLVKEAYDRMQKDVRISYILIKVDQYAAPKDTLAAYKRIMKLRDMALKGNFAKVAGDSSQDPSTAPNGGDIGYFTALPKGFAVPYEFESACYNTKVGGVSMPVRTANGYYLVKVTDVRKAQGEVLAAHILALLRPGSSADDSVKAWNKINDAYKRVKAGEKFEDVAKELSDDKATARNGGMLPWFGPGMMVPDFETKAFSLQNNGDVSEIFRSPFGWHIIKRLDRKELPPFEELQSEIKARVSRDERADLGKMSLISRVKAEAKFTEFQAAKNEFLKVIDTTLLEGKWSPDKAEALNKPLFTLGERTYTQADFTKYIIEHQGRRNKMPMQSLLDNYYRSFVNESCIAYEESMLEKKYPEFRGLMQEYRDGILLFDLTDRMVWSKAVKDSAGLQEFYNKNKNNYMWNERVEAVLYACDNEQTAAQVRKLLKKKKSSAEILKAVNKDSLKQSVSVKDGKFSIGDNSAVDSVKWEKGIAPNVKIGNSIVVVDIRAKLPPMPKLLDECRGLATTDYQAYLDKEWIENLKKKYPVTVRQEVLSTITP